MFEKLRSEVSKFTINYPILLLPGLYLILLLPGSDCSRVSDFDGNLHICVPILEGDLLPRISHLLPHTGQCESNQVLLQYYRRYIIGVKITAVGRDIPLFEGHPALPLSS